MRKTPLKRKTGFKKKTKPRKRPKLPALSTLRNKCDKLLTPIIKAQHPYCMLTGQPTEVAHHFVKKSQSNALRYYIPNLIPLTHKAHQALHNNESYWSGVIIEKLGLEWFEDIKAKKNELVKVDRQWYEGHYENLRSLYDELC